MYYNYYYRTCVYVCFIMFDSLFNIYADFDFIIGKEKSIEYSFYKKKGVDGLNFFFFKDIRVWNNRLIAIIIIFYIQNMLNIYKKYHNDCDHLTRFHIRDYQIINTVVSHHFGRLQCSHTYIVQIILKTLIFFSLLSISYSTPWHNFLLFRYCYTYTIFF